MDFWLSRSYGPSNRRAVQYAWDLNALCATSMVVMVVTTQACCWSYAHTMGRSASYQEDCHSIRQSFRCTLSACDIQTKLDLELDASCQHTQNLDAWTFGPLECIHTMAFTELHLVCIRASQRPFYAGRSMHRARLNMREWTLRSKIHAT